QARCRRRVRRQMSAQSIEQQLASRRLGLYALEPAEVMQRRRDQAVGTGRGLHVGAGKKESAGELRVHTMDELVPQAGLADSRDTEHRDRAASRLLDGLMKLQLESRQIRVAPDAGSRFAEEQPTDIDLVAQAS